MANPHNAHEFVFFDPDHDLAHVKGNLPHWRQDGAIYFATFRAADSLPLARRHAIAADANQARFVRRFHRQLDAGHGECLLADPQCRTIVEVALGQFDGSRYALDEYVVAANHVHVLVTPFPNKQLSAILQSWKSFTAKAINRMYGRSGRFWQKESFDHMLRNQDQLESVRDYIRAHPAWHRTRAARGR
jgi:REP element-mobilizing transposase RayT